MSLEIDTTLQPRGPAGAIILDDAQVAALGEGKKVFPVKVTVNGLTVDLRLGRMGGENLIGFRKEIRQQLGVEIGDALHAVIARDDAPREVEIPPELAEAFAANPDAKAAFDKLAPTHRKEHARSVADAKKPETRTRRVEAVLRAVMGE